MYLLLGVKLWFNIFNRVHCGVSNDLIPLVLQNPTVFMIWDTLSSTTLGAYNLLKNPAFPEKPISSPYESVKELLPSDVQCVKFECRDRSKFHETM